MALDRTTVHGCTRINAFHNYKESESSHLVGQLFKTSFASREEELLLCLASGNRRFY